MTGFTKALFYAGLDQYEMKELMPEARQENGRFLRIYALMTGIVFVICLIVSFVAGGQLDVNKPIYLAMVVINALIYLSVKKVMRKRPALSTPLSIAYILSMYGYAFAVSLVHSELPGTSAVAILVVVPCIFIHRPINMISLTVLSIVVYCVLSANIKTHAIAMLDLWNSLFFGAIAVVLSVYQMRVRFQEMLQKRRNRELSETDLLTGVKNRNCFENNKDQYVRDCRENLTCVYVDVNGLHELNDKQGHEAGDRMLQAVARSMADTFGRDQVYRIGGDEFLAFRAESTVEAVRERIAGMIRTINEMGYSVSVGGALQEKKELNMKELVREAETYMYKEKRKYYEQNGHDRRRRVMEETGT